MKKEERGLNKKPSSKGGLKMLMMENSGKMKRANKKLGFIQLGFDSKPQHRGEAMVRIGSKHHKNLRIHKRDWRNKYASVVWHNTGGRTGCGCRTSRVRFKY